MTILNLIHSDAHLYGARNNSTAFIQIFLSTRGLKNRHYYEAKWLHNLPYQIRSIASYGSFKRLLKLQMTASLCFQFYKAKSFIQLFCFSIKITDYCL